MLGDANDAGSCATTEGVLVQAGAGEDGTSTVGCI